MAKTKNIFDKYNIKTLSESDETPKISTGIVALDEALDGGFPRGHQIELYGAPGGGKSAIAMSTAVQAQKAAGGTKKNVTWIDLESAFVPETAKKAGLNLDSLLYADASHSAEEVMQMVEDLALSGSMDVVVVDSVAGLVTEAEINGDFGDSHVGLTARLLSQATRKLNEKLTESGSTTTIIWVNQVRSTIGGGPFSPQTTTTGGKSLTFWCSVRLDIARIGMVKQGEEVVGQKVKAKVQKSRTSPPFRQAEFDIIYQTGISNGSALVDMALASGLFDLGGGGWITDTMTGEKVQGRLAMAEALDQDESYFKSVKEALTTVK